MTYKKRLDFWKMILLLIAGGVALVACNTSSDDGVQEIPQAIAIEHTPTPPSTATPTQPPPTPTIMLRQESWLTLQALPENATQADVGAEVYRLVCKACHGNKGQGLTDDWRAEWAPEDRNCWQSKCHAPNHLPEGFILPRYVPPVIGPGSLARFKTALDLNDYIKRNMPWHSPSSLTAEEYWQLTAFLMREHQIPLGDFPLNEQRASEILLSP